MKNEKKMSSSIEGLRHNNIHRITKILARCVLIALWAQHAFAHGSEKHVIGTVKNLSEDSITVATLDGKTQEVRVTKATLFERDGHAATLRNLKIGDRVVIHAVTKSGVLEAHTVKIGSTPKG